jgi:CRP-like cAMP-binding protein
VCANAIEATRPSPEQIAEYCIILRQADVFCDLREPQLEMIAHLCTELDPGPGEIILRESSSGRDLFVIAVGEVEVTVDPALVRASSQPNSEPIIIATLRAGQTFGEIAMVDEGLRSASVRSTGRKTRLLRISRDRLIRLCDNYPDLGYVLMRNIAAELAFKLRETGLAIREQIIWRAH